MITTSAKVAALVAAACLTLLALERWAGLDLPPLVRVASIFLSGACAVVWFIGVKPAPRT